ncbi:hypothetical protein VF14_32215 [Nostoc linckia z18]|uniref:Uncharacterized protein n=2 Tax=Nostoc linckia TaxID=92942 RepID=A0A9Q5Z5Q2_NOSLI|nr:hypothetical protein VF03_27935 [Nostoc linckia z2]PHJ66708.1 hypothetical protein VF02_07110 [Nostoc linckia z1]PHJ67060.1 hypothetical protein VF05_17590 [Nostoc linckia z3]PHJ81611.1 hypothetical protein VF06_18275 [Nostoc linckia z4]PHJ89944.1 hypothetical protein VF07_10240 [Nostoc linckia z6]PHJ94766.1 hypothetical protein VF08_33195 [Nostoc linckia z8]PHJ95240.1 hypothetical protein VF04_19665 [Nostoc linckia z7]PHK02799.1 hypothetical protein VF09_31035 [Nostoc linckia z9]PHK1446
MQLKNSFITNVLLYSILKVDLMQFKISFTKQCTIAVNYSKVAKNMYLSLQEFLSRCSQNFANNHKNSSEIAKTSNQGKIILNSQNQSRKLIRVLGMNITQE